MRNFAFTVTTAAALVGSGMLIGSAQAAPIGSPNTIQAAGAGLGLIEDVQYFFGGYDYCWFPDGWRGPGWYVCDYGPWVSGSWWGGPLGWHGWVWHGERRGERHERHERRELKGKSSTHSGTVYSKGLKGRTSYTTGKPTGFKSSGSTGFKSSGSTGFKSSGGGSGGRGHR
jgi:hypothetical protein